MRKIITAAVTVGVVVLATFVPLGSPQSASAVDPITLTADLLQPSGEPLQNKFLANYWDLNGEWTTAATNQSSSYFATNYPQISEAQLMTATGGCYIGYPGCTTNRDLFTDPSDRSTMTDYNFTSLNTAVGNMVSQGLTPFIKTGNVPIKFSTNPAVGTFGVNLRAPDNYNVYFNYIKAMADDLVAHFGLTVVRSINWGVLTEATNPDWFRNPDGTQASTNTDFFKIYDYTVAALEASIGAGHVIAGTHEFNNVGEAWIDHCATGTNFATAGTGTSCSFISESNYQNTPNGSGVPNFGRLVSLRSYAATKGLNLRVGVDEGEFFNGSDNRELLSRTVGDTPGASYEALLFKQLVDQGIDWHTKWNLSTRGTWGGPNGPVLPVDTNVDILSSKMNGGLPLAVSKTGTPANSSDIVDATATFNSATHTADVFAFNHNSSTSATTAESPTVVLNNVQGTSGSSVTVRTWYVDDTHAQFWKAWQADAGAAGITSSDYDYWSPESPVLPATLISPSDRAVYDSHEAGYKSLSQLTSTSTTAVITNGTLTLTPTLQHHGVVLYEVLGVQPTSSTSTFSDDLNDWSKVDDRSSDLAFDTSNAASFSDSSRVYRNASDLSAQRFVTYQLHGISQGSVVGLFNSGAEAVTDFSFLGSSDGATWTSITPSAVADDSLVGGQWTRRTYSLSSLPSGTNFLKILFPSGGLHYYAPQLARVQLGYAPQLIQDDLNDWSKLGGQGSHDAFVFDTANSGAFGDSSRIYRSSTTLPLALTYHYVNTSSISATVLYNSGEEPIQSMQFDASPDGVTWAPLYAGSYTDVTKIPNVWIERNYNVPTPAGTNFVRVRFPTGGAHVYAPQLGKMVIAQ